MFVVVDVLGGVFPVIRNVTCHNLPFHLNFLPFDSNEGGLRRVVLGFVQKIHHDFFILVGGGFRGKGCFLLLPQRIIVFALVVLY